ALRVQAASPSATTLMSTGLTLGAATSSSLTFDLNGVDTNEPLIATAALAVHGTANVAIQNGGGLLPGAHPLLGYASIGGAGTFAGSPFTLGPRTTGTLLNDGTSALSLNVAGDRPIWTG